MGVHEIKEVKAFRIQIARKEDQPGGLPATGWVRRTKCPDTVEFYSPRKHEGMVLAGKWMEAAEIMTLNEVSHVHKDSHMPPLMFRI